MSDTLHETIAAGKHVKPVQLAGALNISLNGLYHLIRKGEVKTVRLGKSLRISAAEARRLLDLPNEKEGTGS